MDSSPDAWVNFNLLIFPFRLHSLHVFISDSSHTLKHMSIEYAPHTLTIYSKSVQFFLLLFAVMPLE